MVAELRHEKRLVHLGRFGEKICAGAEDYPTHKGSVLYLALEDDYARSQKSLSKMFGTDSVENFHFAAHAKNVDAGQDRQLKKFVREHADAKQIIIDTSQRIREVGGEKFSYGSDYEIVTKLKQFAEQSDICILLIYHTRKKSALIQSPTQGAEKKSWGQICGWRFPQEIQPEPLGGVLRKTLASRGIATPLLLPNGE